MSKLRYKVGICFLLVAVVVSVLMVSCKDNDMKVLRISSYATLGDSPKSSTSKGPSVVDLEFKEEIKNAVSSEETVTPVAFTLNLNEASIYRPKDDSDIQGGAYDWISIVGNGEYGNSRNTNILCTKGIDSIPVSYNSESVYNGVAFSFLPFVGTSNGNAEEEPVRLISAICIKLPEGIEAESVANRYNSNKLTDFGEDYVWFEYSSLIPYAISKDAFLSYICFQTGIEKGTLVGAEDHSDEIYVYGPVNTRGNACALSVPMQQPLDLTAYENPEVCLNYNIKDLIQFFKQEDGSYYAFFNVSDPFPISISIGEYSEENGPTIPDQPSDEDSYPFNCYKIRRKDCMLLQYTKPTNQDYRKVQIFKCQSDIEISEAQEIVGTYDSTGDLVEKLNLLYEGNADYYQDMMDNSKESTASYFIRALTGTGKSSLVKFKFWSQSWEY